MIIGEYCPPQLLRKFLPCIEAVSSGAISLPLVRRRHEAANTWFDCERRTSTAAVHRSREYSPSGAQPTVARHHTTCVAAASAWVSAWVSAWPSRFFSSQATLDPKIQPQPDYDFGASSTFSQSSACRVPTPCPRSRSQNRIEPTANGSAGEWAALTDITGNGLFKRTSNFFGSSGFGLIQYTPDFPSFCVQVRRCSFAAECLPFPCVNRAFQMNAHRMEHAVASHINQQKERMENNVAILLGGGSPQYYSSLPRTV